MSSRALYRRLLLFTWVTLAGMLANSLALELNDVPPLLLGMIAPMLLMLRLGFLAGILSLALVLIPITTPQTLIFAALQLFLLWPARRFLPMHLVIVTTIYLCIVIAVLDYRNPLQDPLYLSLSALLFTSNFLMNCAGTKMLFDVTASKTERSQQTLQHQLASRIATYSAIPASLLTMAALYGATVLDLSRHNATQLQLTQQVAAELSNQLTGYVKQLELTRQHLDKVPQSELLRELVKSNPAFISALRTDAQGTVVGFYKEFIAADILNSSVAHREYFKIPQATLKPVVTNVFQGQQLGRDLLFAVAVPLFVADKFAGVLEVSVSLERLTSQFPQVAAPSDYQFVLVDGASLKLWGVDKLNTPLGQPLNLEANQLVSTVQLFENSWFNPVQAVSVSNTGAHMLQTIAITETSWMLLQYSQMTPLYLRYEGYQALAQLLLALLVVLIRYSSRQFVLSYTDTLTHVIQSLERLEPSQEQMSSIPHRASAKEFNELQTSFNRMQYRIAQAHRQIQQMLQEKTQLSAELEQRVQTRTRELATERDKANELASIKSRFLANMSHELRTPLSIIQGYAGEMQRQPLPIQAQEQLKSICEHSQFLLHIVNDILDTAKIDEGKLRLDPQPVPLAALLQEMGAALSLLTSQKGLTAELILAPTLPSVIITDSFRLQQIVMNLMSNAVKFTDSGYVRFSAVYQAPRLILSVEDSGAGISTEQQQRIFQAFEQADVSTTRQFGGTGLGLYISQRLAEMLDAQLYLRSTVGQGSCFTLDMPVTLGEAETHQAQPILASTIPLALPHKTILIVDDVRELRLLFASMFSGSGADILQAAHGDDALALIRRYPIDLVLLDMHMPVRDGLSTLKLLRQTHPRLPVIALTADVQPQKHQEILGAGGQLVLTKPVDRELLTQAVADLFKTSMPSVEATQLSAQTTLPATDNTETQVQSDLVAVTPFDALQLSFIADLSAQLQALQQASVDEQQQLLHKLKGTAACLDFGMLSQLALLAETQLKEHKECHDELAAIASHIQELQTALRDSPEPS